MIGVIAGLAAILGLFDLFSKPDARIMPWWGDVVVMLGAAAVYLASRMLGAGEDD